MTCIVGLKNAGKVYIGADSISMLSYKKERRADEKVFTNGPYLIAFTSSFRFGQVLRYSFKPPIPKSQEDLMEFMTTAFITALQREVKTHKLEELKPPPGSIMVGFGKDLFVIDTDYQVANYLDDYCARGYGAETALGAMFITNMSSRLVKYPKTRITLALEAAKHHCAAVEEPFVIKECPPVQYSDVPEGIVIVNDN